MPPHDVDDAPQTMNFPSRSRMLTHDKTASRQAHNDVASSGPSALPRVFITSKGRSRPGDFRRANMKENVVAADGDTSASAARKRKANSVDDAHRHAAMAGPSSNRPLKALSLVRPLSKVMASKRLDLHFEKAYEPDCATDATSRVLTEAPISSSDEETQGRLERTSIPQSSKRRRPVPTSREGQRIKELEKELELTRRLAADKSQAAESLKKELLDSKKANRLQEKQLEKQEVACKKANEVLSAVQSHLQCQICLDMLAKPFALSPCGHVICKSCLQSWFRGAPPQEGEEDETNVDARYRKKTCPCCRTRVAIRPIPLYVLKNIVSLFPSEAQADDNPLSEESEEDPWDGIFFEQINASEDEYYETGFSDEEEMENEEHYESASDASSWEERYGQGDEFVSDEGGEHGEDEDEGHSDSDSNVMFFPEWAPPHQASRVSRLRYPYLGRTTFELLQRGASPRMISKYRMVLSPRDGIVASTEDAVYYLGWNIFRPEHDPDGDAFMEWVKSDVIIKPQLWHITLAGVDGGIPNFWRLSGGCDVLGLEDDDDSD